MANSEVKEALRLVMARIDARLQIMREGWPMFYARWRRRLRIFVENIRPLVGYWCGIADDGHFQIVRLPGVTLYLLRDYSDRVVKIGICVLGSCHWWRR